MNAIFQNDHLKALLDNLGCPCCGELNPNPEFFVLINKLETIKSRLNFPLPVFSAYRCAVHPVEITKSQPGPHSVAAIHVGVNRGRAFQFVMEALREGINGIGVNQYGPMNQRYIHLDLRDKKTIWVG